MAKKQTASPAPPAGGESGGGQGGATTPPLTGTDPAAGGTPSGTPTGDQKPAGDQTPAEAPAAPPNTDESPIMWVCPIHNHWGTRSPYKNAIVRDGSFWCPVHPGTKLVGTHGTTIVPNEGVPDRPGGQGP